MVTNINTILSWFKTRSKPTQEQFWASWSSFWHKDEQIPQASISNLTTTLDTKTDQSQFHAHITDNNAHLAAFEKKIDKGDYNGTAQHLKNDIDSVEQNLLENYYDISKVNEGLAAKLDKGSFNGNAQDLKNDIDSIYQPNLLISSIIPTRVLNTFTYQAGQYKYLINKTTQTLLSDFIVTIPITSAPNLKRIDLIQAHTDGTFSRKSGSENAVIATQPQPDSNCVPISFINIFGNTIENPTPITAELSIQDYSGTEQFKVSNYLRFKGVSFDPESKALVSNPLIPLSAFLDPINGSDKLGTIENADKPFRTINALLEALPNTKGETYTLYITGGNIDITRTIIPRNLKFIAYSNCVLNFTNIKSNDGLTDLEYVFEHGRGVWTFENENISIYCNFNGKRRFTFLNNDAPITIKGTLNEIKWNSTGAETYISGFMLGASSDFKVLFLRESIYSTPTIGTYATGIYNIRIVNYTFTTGNPLIGKEGATYNVLNLIIDNIIQIGTNQVMLRLSNQNGINSLELNNLKFNVPVLLQPLAIKIKFNTITDINTKITLQGCYEISGTITGVNYPYNGYQTGNQYFKNYSGNLSKIDSYFDGNVYFENCNLLTDTYLLGRGYNSTVENCVHFSGYNSIYQINTNHNLFLTYGLGLPITKPIKLDFDSLITNVSSFGNATSYIKRQIGFKEETNKIVIRSKIDLVNKTLNSNNIYVIDSTDMVLLSGEYILVPEDGLTITGYGLNVSTLNKNILGESIFKSPVGGSGNLVVASLKISSGLGNVFDIVDSNGTHVIEVNNINFSNCNSLGKISGYKQFTGTTVGMHSCNDGLTLSGKWNKFMMSKLHVSAFNSSGTLFKKDTDTFFSNKFYLQANISGTAGYKVLDFDNTNFIKNRMLQLDNCTFEVDDAIDVINTTSLVPNISPNDPKCKWINSEGITLTAFNFLDILSPDGKIWRIEINNTGNVTTTVL